MSYRKCKICNDGKYYERLGTHLRRIHDIDIIDYYKIYDIEKYQEIEREDIKFQFIKEFYISYRQEYIMMDENKKIYTKISNTSSNKRKRVYPLSDWMIRQHLKQKTRLGIKFPGSGSNIIGLDIDTLEVSVLKTIYKKLIAYGISKNNLLMTFSGNKGYHCDIFLEEYLDRQSINSFYGILLEDTNYNKTTVELRGGCNKGYFLPLSLNFKGVNDVNKHYGYCGIVEENGIMEYDDYKEIEILRSIHKLNPSLIKKIVAENISKLLNKDIILKESSTRSVNQEDLKVVSKTLDTLNDIEIYSNNASDIVRQIKKRTSLKKDTRHKNAFVLALALRDIGKNQREVYEDLISWHEHLKSGYKSNWAEIQVDCKKISTSTFQKEGISYRYNLKKNYRSFVTKDNIVQFIKIENDAEKRVFMSLAIHANKFADKDGQFYMTYKQMNESLGMQARNGDLLSYIKRLESKGIVEIISRNKRRKGSYKHKPNIYRIVSAYTEEYEGSQEEERYYLEEDAIKKIEMKKAIKEILIERKYTRLVNDKDKLNKLVNCFLS